MFPLQYFRSNSNNIAVEDAGGRIISISLSATNRRLSPSQAVETEHNTDTGYVDETIEDYMHINIELATGQ